MPIPIELLPVQKRKVIDLVSAAGIDVSDWGNFKGGHARASTNPKYCYNWAFIEPGKVIVLNLWHSEMQEQHGLVFQDINYRANVAKLSKSSARGTWAKRSLEMDAALSTAATARLPVRVIVCDGIRRDVTRGATKSSNVTKRLLDPIPWAVTASDLSTGQFTVTRGAVPSKFVDQFMLPIEGNEQLLRREVTGTVVIRNASVRMRVLDRAAGKCEYCNVIGFKMEMGRVYLETHHILPLAKNGPDNERNVVALCANHHREAHYGLNADEMGSALKDIVARKLNTQKQ
jgi:5-methylcytosine-specific restriction protein A